MSTSNVSAKNPPLAVVETNLNAIELKPGINHNYDDLFRNSFFLQVESFNKINLDLNYRTQ